MSFREQGGWWVIGQSVLMGAIGLAGPFYAAPVDAWLKLAAGGVAMVGAVIGVAGAVTLGRNRTAYPAPLASGELVQHGIYARVRHPLYSSMILLAVGWSLWWGSPGALLMTIGFGFLLDAKAEDEERRLVVRFPEYERYRRRVPRLVPWMIRVRREA